MGTVVSLGSINVDLVRTVSGEEIARLAEEREWLPPAGATVSVPSRPDVGPVSFRSFLGGKGANQAVAAANAGAESVLLGAVGTDQAEYDVIETIRDRGVVVRDVERVDAPTGVAYVFVEADGENRIVVVDGANGAVDAAYVNETYETVAVADCLLLQNEIPVPAMETLLDRLASASDRPTVLFNPSPVDGARVLVGHDAVDVVSVNETEYRALGASLDVVDATVVQTRGESEVRVAGPEPFSVTPPTVTPVDTTGAGDAFNGYVAAGLADGESIRSAVETAVTAAAVSTTRDGAQAAIPTREAVRAFDRPAAPSER